jgi:post-segregation antitoxin (ccd killing protein)
MRIRRPEEMRVVLYDTDAAKRPVNLTMNGDLVTRARAEGFNLSALAQRARQKWAEDIAQACRAHDRYLAEYGSLSDAVDAETDGA